MQSVCNRHAIDTQSAFNRHAISRALTWRWRRPRSTPRMKLDAAADGRPLSSARPQATECLCHSGTSSIFRHWARTRHHNLGHPTANSLVLATPQHCDPSAGSDDHTGEPQPQAMRLGADANDPSEDVPPRPAHDIASAPWYEGEEGANLSDADDQASHSIGVGTHESKEDLKTEYLLE